ncbi:uncharacterized protein [Halyomorpha halys]|uniref:uncharacterized protein n=1 Tax=Halyomorpha halys TaxID=286706 RepID=UPI0034D2788C
MMFFLFSADDQAVVPYTVEYGHLNGQQRRIFRNIVEHSLKYAAETWTLDTGLYSKIQAAEMDFWRRCLRIARLDRVKDEETRSRLWMAKGVPERIGRSRLQWYGHCQRMPGRRWPKRLLLWEQPGRRKRGSPRNRWKRTWLAGDLRRKTGGIDRSGGTL